MHLIRGFILVVFFLGISFFSVQAIQEQPSTDAAESSNDESLDISSLILHHVMDDHQWAITENWIIPLPIIVYSTEKGLDVFSSSHLYHHHQPVVYRGYTMEHNHIRLVDSDAFVLDLSITKNVAMLFINALLLVVVFLWVARLFKERKGKVPIGIQSFIEPIIVFVRDEVVRPNIGPRYEKYLPYLLTLFFFILFGNLLGLFPGAANLTGNIAVTLTLAVFTFIITNFSGNKWYWKHIFWTPGVPLLLRLVFLPVEIIGLFTKPFALMIRLFVAITAGHIVILSLISLTFIFASIWVGVGASIIVLFINLIELLVAGIQAYVFTLFSSLYIGLAIEEHHAHEKH